MKTERGFLPRMGLAGMLVLTLAIAGCGDDGAGPEEGPMAEYAGTWEGTQFALVSAANSQIAFDLIGAGGSMVFSVQANGNFSGTATIPGALMGAPEMGTITIPLSGVMNPMDGGKLRISFIPEIPPLFTTMDPEATLVGNTLSLYMADGAFDFDQDGVTETAILQGEMVRN